MSFHGCLNCSSQVQITTYPHVHSTIAWLRCCWVLKKLSTTFQTTVGVSVKSQIQKYSTISQLVETEMVRPFVSVIRFFNSLRLIIEESSMSLAKRNHGKYFCRFLNLLPPRLSCHDSTRATIAFFSISGLDVLDLLDLLSEESKHNIIEWFYSLQVTPAKGNDVRCSGFMVSM